MLLDPPVLVALAVAGLVVAHCIHSGVKESRERRRRHRSQPVDRTALFPWRPETADAASGDDMSAKEVSAKAKAATDERMESSVAL